MPSSSRGVKLLSESLERLAFVFARPLSGARHGACCLACLGSAFAPRDALGCFLVEGLRDRGAASLLAGAFDDDVPLIPALPNPQHVSRRDFP